MLTAAPPRRSVDVPTTASTGVSNSNAVTESHSARPSPSHLLDSQKQHKAPVGLIVGVALAVIAALFGLFFVRYLFIRRKRRRESFAGAGRTLGGAAPRSSTAKEGAGGMPIPMPPLARPGERDAVELGSYPPTALPPSSFPPSLPPTHTRTESWGTVFAPATTAAEPGPQSEPAARQAYLAAELRAAQSLLERAGRGGTGDKSVDVKATKARIRELEQRQGSAWAVGLE
ncbi:hypothetical protein C8R45DRAFT_1031311 [Mycena sanguinolenta]|nr:hypothetical protein C8R45DRAFT_1031311 [Mycena sanguinolenta]